MRIKTDKQKKWCPLEHQEQVVFVRMARLAYPSLILAAVPNGGFRNPREAVKLKREGTMPGYPDILIDIPRGAYHGIRVEMKRIFNSSVPASQKECHKVLRDNGYCVVVARGAEVAFNLLKEYMSLKSGDLSHVLDNAD